MKRRLKIGIVIYLIFLGAGIVAYFGIQAAKGKYAIGGGDINIFAQTQAPDTSKPKPGIRVPGPGETAREDTAHKVISGKDSALTKPPTDTTARLVPESTTTAKLPAPDTAGKTTSSQTNIKPSGGKSDFPEIKPAVDLSSGGLDIKIKTGGGLSGPSADLGLGTGPQVKIGTGEQLGGGKSSGSKPATDVSSGSSSASSEVLKLEKELESAYRNAHDLDKTMSIANSILKIDPTNSKATFYIKIVKAERKALAYEDAGDSEKALAEWKKILSWDPGNKWAQKGVERNE